MMRFKEIFEIANGKPIFSLEFFPPRKNEGLDELYNLISELSKLSPAFATCTFRPDGTSSLLTKKIVEFIHNELNLNSVSHLTCVGQSKDEVRKVLNSLNDSSIRSVLALRGDPPKGTDSFTPNEDGFTCARDLVKFINEDFSNLSVAVAAYPEGHQDAKSVAEEIDYLKEKIDAGAEVIITQLFLDLSFFEKFMERLISANINIPVIPGIMPIRNVGQLKRFTSLCKATIPKEIERTLSNIEKDKEAVIDFGIEFATNFCRELIKLGAPGIHFYTLNKERQIQEIINRLMSDKILFKFNELVKK